MNINEIANTIIRGEPAVKFPLKYDRMGTMVLDANNGMFLDVRGWGRISYHPDGEEAAAKLQDAIGDWIVVTLNAKAKEEGLY